MKVPSGASVTETATIYTAAAKETCAKLSNSNRACEYIDEFTYEIAANIGSATYTDSQLKTWCDARAPFVSIGGSIGTKFELPESVKGLNQLGTTSLPVLLGRFLRILMGIVGSIALVILVYGGLMWMTAAGNAEKEGKAKSLLVWGALGVMAILASYAIVNFIFDIF
jgi:hypothetical protein